MIESLKKKLNGNNDGVVGGSDSGASTAPKTMTETEVKRKKEKEEMDMEVMTVVGSTKAKSVDEAIQSVFKEVSQSNMNIDSSSTETATATKPILTNDEIGKRGSKI